MLSQGKLLSNDVVARLFKTALLRGEGTHFLVEGYPASKEQAEAMEEKMGVTADLAVCLVDGSMTAQTREVVQYYTDKGAARRVDAEQEAEGGPDATMASLREVMR